MIPVFIPLTFIPYRMYTRVYDNNFSLAPSPIDLWEKNLPKTEEKWP